MERSARQAYALSTCHKFVNNTFTKLVKKYEHYGGVCSKYQFDIWITLDIPRSPDSKDFELIKAHNNFLNSRYDLGEFEANILEELNTLTSSEKQLINAAYAKLTNNANPANADFADHCRKHLYTIINLIRLYQAAAKYKYIFLPFTLDYSQDVGLVHQCSLLIDLEDNLFIFYEPYGTYVKYEHNYATPIKKYLEIYSECFAIPFGFTTFHERFVPEFLSTYGIQSMILNSNNAKEEEYRKDLQQLLSDLKEQFPDLYRRIIKNLEKDNNPVNKTDKTISILSVLDRFTGYSRTASNSLAFNALWKRALELYYLYNSKTCVSITLMEMNALFAKENLQELYTMYKDAAIPNKILMQKLSDILYELHGDEANFDEKNSTPLLC